MRILHTMIRVVDLDASLAFYTEVLGMQLLRRQDYPEAFEARAQCPEVEAPILVRRADGTVDPGIARVRLAVGFPPGL